MKIKNGFFIRDIAGKTFVVAVGERSKSFNAMVSLNETAKFIWNILEVGATKEEIINKLLANFEEADKTTVEKDVDNFISLLERDGIIE